MSGVMWGARLRSSRMTTRVIGNHLRRRSGSMPIFLASIQTRSRSSCGSLEKASWLQCRPLGRRARKATRCFITTLRRKRACGTTRATPCTGQWSRSTGGWAPRVLHCRGSAGASQALRRTPSRSRRPAAAQGRGMAARPVMGPLAANRRMATTSPTAARRANQRALEPLQTALPRRAAARTERAMLGVGRRRLPAARRSRPGPLRPFRRVPRGLLRNRTTRRTARASLPKPWPATLATSQ
mmetsp:Transcript_77082/g.213017  ORF Transcript_77082/g.213017 Transcript_77082/m.213017 type:complete len:241 (+) Transcript_77082:110-832(+)